MTKIKIIIPWGFLGGIMLKNPPANVGGESWIPESEDTLEKGKATHSVLLSSGNVMVRNA